MVYWDGVTVSNIGTFPNLLSNKTQIIEVRVDQTKSPSHSFLIVGSQMPMGSPYAGYEHNTALLILFPRNLYLET